MRSTVVLALACLLTLGVPADTAAPTPARVAATGTPTTFRVEDLRGPVEDLRGSVEDLVFPESSTDSQGTDDYNAALSKRRAESVRTALTHVLGSAVTVTATGKGEADPIANNKTKTGQRLNRRVTITLTSSRP